MLLAITDRRTSGILHFCLHRSNAALKTAAAINNAGTDKPLTDCLPCVAEWLQNR